MLRQRQNSTISGFYIMTIPEFMAHESMHSSRIQHPTYTFGGKIGSICSSIAFKKCLSWTIFLLDIYLYDYTFLTAGSSIFKFWFWLHLSLFDSNDSNYVLSPGLILELNPILPFISLYWFRFCSAFGLLYNDYQGYCWVTIIFSYRM